MQCRYYLTDIYEINLKVYIPYRAVKNKEITRITNKMVNKTH